MALLTLKDIGKIYVSDGNVVVGIRGVNLSFDRGEFVAVTGKSGSGKSTLLNVISGMDTYEEGELYIEGQPTSHYLQPEWELYREEYISFIFQDYNIIESFTVLQNVELALMHIDDPKQRRNKALELLEKVGMTSHIHHKGSKLSGGQKQRTVIARALAKDSPIILADEPTGNLDSHTSEEIIELLREVSKDKLVIVVTHNFEQLAACATRHIRIFDGAVESDHVLIPAKTEGESVNKTTEKTVKKTKAGFVKGFTLGRTIFTAKPKLSFFLCLLMIIGTLGIFMVTTLCGDAAMLFKKNYMFEPIDGRVVITKQNGEVITEEELQELAKTCQAQNVLHYDILLDESYGIALGYYNAAKDLYEYINCQFTYNEDFGKDIVGAYPKEVNEVFLYLPISYQPTFGKDTVKIKEININSTTWQVSGIQYYYDNNQTARCLFTEDGFRTATAIYYLLNRGNLNIDVQLKNDAGNTVNAMQFFEFTPSFAVEKGKIYLGSKAYQTYVKDKYKTEIYFTSTYMNYNYNYADSVKTYLFSQTFTDEDLTKNAPNVDDSQFYINKDVMIHPLLLLDFTEEVLGRAYKQASLFFADNEAAHAAAQKISDLSYVAVPADTTYSPDAVTAIASILASLMLALVWLMGIVFLAFFINLCSARTLDAFKGDMAIMRSMGISVKTIRIGMYVRMLFSLVPAFILLIVTAFLIFTTPTFNAYFVYLYPWQYAVIILGMLYLTVRITHKQIRRLFGESVKKALKGGSAA